MFFNPAEFDFIHCFRQQWLPIRQEFDKLGVAVLDVHRGGSHAEYFRMTAGKNGWAPSWKPGSREPNYDWLTYGLSYTGQFPHDAHEKFPVTMALLKSEPRITAAAFSKMMPLSIIPPHNHPERGIHRLTFHLGIDVKPRTSYVCVNGIFEQELDNKPIVFDGSVDHFAVNVAQTSRTILYVEFNHEPTLRKSG